MRKPIGFGTTGFLCERGLLWFRVFGYGLHFKNSVLHPDTFAMRNGYRRRLSIGAWRVFVLYRSDLVYPHPKGWKP